MRGEIGRLNEHVANNGNTNRKSDDIEQIKKELIADQDEDKSSGSEVSVIRQDPRTMHSLEKFGIRDPMETFPKLSSEKRLNEADPSKEFQDMDHSAARENDGNGNGNGNGRSRNTKGKNNKNKREFMVYKYSNRKKADLHEAVILSGKPAFLKCENELIKAVERIEEDIRVINPPHAENYPYEPYEFKDMHEVLSYVEWARKETIDSLYLQAKQIAFDYNDHKEEKLILLAIEIVWSYFQDKFPTTHYDIVLGGNGLRQKFLR